MRTMQRAAVVVFLSLLVVAAPAGAADRTMQKAIDAVAAEIERYEAAPVCCRSWSDLGDAVVLPRGKRLTKVALAGGGAVAEFPGGKSRYVVLDVGAAGGPRVMELFLERKSHSMWQTVMSVFLPQVQFLDAANVPLGDMVRPDFEYQPYRATSGFYATVVVPDGAAFAVLHSDPSHYGRMVGTGTVPNASAMGSFDFGVAVIASPQGAVRARLIEPEAVP